MTTLVGPADRNYLVGILPNDGSQALRESGPASQPTYGNKPYYTSYGVAGAPIPHLPGTSSYQEYNAQNLPQHGNPFGHRYPHKLEPQSQEQHYQQCEYCVQRQLEHHSHHSHQDMPLRPQKHRCPPGWSPPAVPNWSSCSGSCQNLTQQQHWRDAPSPHPAPPASGSLLPATPISEPVANTWHPEGWPPLDASHREIMQSGVGLQPAPPPVQAQAQVPSPPPMGNKQTLTDLMPAPSNAPAANTAGATALATTALERRTALPLYPPAPPPVPPPPPPPPLALNTRHSGTASDQPTAAAGSSAGVTLSAGGAVSAAYGAAAELAGPCGEAGSGLGSEAVTTSAVRQASRPPLPPITTGLPCQQLLNPHPPQHHEQQQQQQPGQGQGSAVAPGKGPPAPREPSCQHPSAPGEPKLGTSLPSQAASCFDYATMWRVVGDTLEWTPLPPPAPTNACGPGAPGSVPCTSVASGAIPLQGRLSSSHPHPPGNVITTGNSIERPLPPLPLCPSGSGKMAPPAVPTAPMAPPMPPAVAPIVPPAPVTQDSPQPPEQQQQQAFLQTPVRRPGNAVSVRACEGGGGAEGGCTAGAACPLVPGHLSCLRPRSGVPPNAVTTGAAPIAAISCALVSRTIRPALVASGVTAGCQGMPYRTARHGREGDGEAHGTGELADDAFSTCGCIELQGRSSTGTLAVAPLKLLQQQRQRQPPSGLAPEHASAQLRQGQVEQQGMPGEDAEEKEDEEDKESETSESSEEESRDMSQDQLEGEGDAQKHHRGPGVDALWNSQQEGPDRLARQRPCTAPGECGAPEAQQAPHGPAAAQPAPQPHRPCEIPGLPAAPPPAAPAQCEGPMGGGYAWWHGPSPTGVTTCTANAAAEQPQLQCRTSRSRSLSALPPLASPFCGILGCTACGRYGGGPGFTAAHDGTDQTQAQQQGATVHSEAQQAWNANKRRRLDAPPPPAPPQQTQQTQQLPCSHLPARSQLMSVPEPARDLGASAGAGTLTVVSRQAGPQGSSVAWATQAAWGPNGGDVGGYFTHDPSNALGAGPAPRQQQQQQRQQQRQQQQQPQHGARADAWPAHLSQSADSLRWPPAGGIAVHGESYEGTGPRAQNEACATPSGGPVRGTVCIGQGGSGGGGASSGSGGRKRACHDGEYSGTNSRRSSYSGGGSGDVATAAMAAQRRDQQQQQSYGRGRSIGAAGRSDDSGYPRQLASFGQPLGPLVPYSSQPAGFWPVLPPGQNGPPLPALPSAPSGSADTVAPVPPYGSCTCAACLQACHAPSAPSASGLCGTSPGSGTATATGDSATAATAVSSWYGRALPGCTCDQCRSPFTYSTFTSSQLLQPPSPLPPPAPHPYASPYPSPSSGHTTAPYAVPMSYMERMPAHSKALGAPQPSQLPPPDCSTSGQEQGLSQDQGPPGALPYDRGASGSRPVAAGTSSSSCMCQACRSTASFGSGAPHPPIPSFGSDLSTYNGTTAVYGRPYRPAPLFIPDLVTENTSPNSGHRPHSALRTPWTGAPPQPPPPPYSASVQPQQPPPPPYVASVQPQQLVATSTLPASFSYPTQQLHHHHHNPQPQHSYGYHGGAPPCSCCLTGQSAGTSAQHPNTATSPRFYQHQHQEQQQHYHHHHQPHQQQQQQHQRHCRAPLPSEPSSGCSQGPPPSIAQPTAQPAPYMGHEGQQPRGIPSLSVPPPPRPAPTQSWQCYGHPAPSPYPGGAGAFDGSAHCTTCCGVDGIITTCMAPPPLPPPSNARFPHPWQQTHGFQSQQQQQHQSQDSRTQPGSGPGSAPRGGHVAIPALPGAAVVAYQQRAPSESAALSLGAPPGNSSTVTVQALVVPAPSTALQAPLAATVATVAAAQDLCGTSAQSAHLATTTNPTYSFNPRHLPLRPEPGPSDASALTAAVSGTGTGAGGGMGSGGGSALATRATSAAVSVGLPSMGSLRPLLTATDDEEDAMWAEDPLMPWSRRSAMRPT